jgi:uncharacterized protein YjaG (DUF416 family)
MNPDVELKRGLELHSARIDQLPTCLKAALAAACAQRQADVYRVYSRRTGDGNSRAFDNLLSEIWEDIRCKQASEQDHNKWHERGERLYPSRNAKADIYSAGAELAVLSLLHSNSVLLTGKSQGTVHAAHQTFESVDNFLTSPIGKKPQFDIDQADAIAKLLAHPLTVAEHRRQERDLLDLEEILSRPDLTPDAVDKLRKRAEIEAKDFLPIIEGPGQ